MDQITNLNNAEVTGVFSGTDQSVKVEGSNKVFVNNQQTADMTNNINFEMVANSSLDLTLFDLNETAKVSNKINFELAENAKLKVVIVSLNSGQTDASVTVNLNASHAEAEVNVISVANTGVDTTFNVICNNNAAHTNANITQRAVALNGGSNVFEATGYIGTDCAKAVNFQESRVLLLDGAAKGDASPILLINHHDVEAGHAAGVSRVSDEEMYYLMSRGIPRKTAEELMTVAFIRPVVDKINDEELRESVFEKINKKASYENN